MFKSTLKFQSKEFDIRFVDYEIKRDVDAKGRPASHLYGGIIKITIESTEDTTIIENIVSQFKPHEGTVVYKKGDEESVMKELKWEKGYITRFQEVADVEGKKPMVIKFEVSAQKLTIGGAVFEQDWPDAK